MKIKTSMKICNNYGKVWRCRYAEIENIFGGYMEPIAYNCGVYGWNCDIYIDNVTDQIITTGYRNTRGKLIPKEILKKYDSKAKKIRENYYKSNANKFEDIRKKMLKLAVDFWIELENIYFLV